MCVAGLPAALLPLWQVVQLVAALKVLWSTRAPAQVVVLLWQLSQLPVTPLWVAVVGLPVAPRYEPPGVIVWQVAQPVLTL